MLNIVFIYFCRNKRKDGIASYKKRSKRGTAFKMTSFVNFMKTTMDSASSAISQVHREEVPAAGGRDNN